MKYTFTVEHKEIYKVDVQAEDIEEAYIEMDSIMAYDTLTSPVIDEWSIVSSEADLPEPGAEEEPLNLNIATMREQYIAAWEKRANL